MDKKWYVMKPSQMKTIDQGNTLRTWVLVTSEIGAKNLTTGITEFQDGAAIPLHTHNCEEQITILAGSAVAEIDGLFHELESPDTTFIPAGIPHRFLNRSGSPMKILWIYGSAEVYRTFVETGQTVPHLELGDKVF